MKIWIVSTGSIIVGVLAGALIFAEDVYLGSRVPPPVPSGVSITHLDQANIADTNALLDNAAGSIALADASDKEERSLSIEETCVYWTSG